MLYPVEIDLAPGFGWMSSPEFQTDVKMLRSGREKRRGLNDVVRHRYTLPYNNITSNAYLSKMKAAFLAVRGQLHAFIVKDASDYLAVNDPLGVAPAGSTPVQLVHVATFGSASYTRTITKPVAATVVVLQNGVAKPGAADPLTGLFTPATPWATLLTPVISSVTTAATGGSLASGATYSYRVGATNDMGETLASAAVSRAVAAALATPVNAAFTTATTGGSLAAATYSYRVAAKNTLGRTLASTATTITTSGTTSTVTVNWGAVSGATGYDVFGRVGGSELLIASVGEVTTYTDTGTITPAGALPTANTTATATNTNTVNWGAVSGATGYKVYGRTTSGELLIASVGAVTTYTDTGSVTPSGSLPAANTTHPNISWSGEFRVPVRFASDSLPMSIDDRFGAGGAYAMNGSIDLVEVFGE